MGRNKSEGEYVADSLLPFVGAVIIGTAISADDDPYFQFPGLIVRAEDGSEHVLWVQQDAEGNGPGWISPEKTKAAPKATPKGRPRKRNGTPVAKAPSDTPMPAFTKDEKQRRCLALLAEEGGRIVPEYIAKHTGLRLSSAKFALRVLTSCGLVSHNAGAYRITDRGRMAVAS